MISTVQEQEQQELQLAQDLLAAKAGGGGSGSGGKSALRKSPSDKEKVPATVLCVPCCLPA